jgi:hypothetical protein
LEVFSDGAVQLLVLDFGNTILLFVLLFSQFIIE